MECSSNGRSQGLRFRRDRVIVAGVAALVLVLAGSFFFPSVRAWYHYRAARSAAERHDLAAEYSHLCECRKGWPNNASVCLKTAQAARRLGHFDEAERCLRHYERLNGDPADGAMERLLVKLARHDADLDSEAALESVRRTPQDHPAVPEALEGLSKYFLGTYRLKEARAALSLWVEREPNNAAPLLLRGWVAEQLDPDRGPPIPDYRRAVEVEPENNAARLRLVEGLVKTRQAAEAMTELKVLRRRQPNNPAVLLNLALCQDDLGDRTEAAHLLDELLSPGRLALVQELGGRIRVDRPPANEIENTDWYQAAMSTAPFGSQGQPHYVVDLYIQALVERAKLAPREGRDGLPYLRQAVQLDPYDALPAHYLLTSLEKRGLEEEASRVRAQLARIEEDRRRISGAAFRVVQFPDAPQPRCTMADILLRNGQPGEALRWLRGVLAVRPNDPEALRLLAVYQRQTRTTGREKQTTRGD